MANSPSGGPTLVHPDVLARLRCNRCGGGVEPADQGLACAEGHLLRAANGYIDAEPDDVDVETAATLKSFGYEWTHFTRTSDEDEAFWKEYFADVPRDVLQGAWVADVGCGMGRYTRITARSARHLMALDGSIAVETAVQTLAAEDNVTLIKADLRSPPLAHGAFDLVTSLGVLHHLVKPLEGFEAISRLVRPGGHLLVYLYSRPVGRSLRGAMLASAAIIRRVTVRLPHALTRALSGPMALLLYGAFVVPGAIAERRGWAVESSLPLRPYRRRSLRVLWLDTFDRLSAPVEHRYRPGEVIRWFTDGGFDVVAVREYAGIVVLGQRRQL